MLELDLKAGLVLLAVIACTLAFLAYTASAWLVLVCLPTGSAALVAAGINDFVRHGTGTTWVSPWVGTWIATTANLNVDLRGHATRGRIIGSLYTWHGDSHRHRRWITSWSHSWVAWGRHAWDLPGVVARGRDTAMGYWVAWRELGRVTWRGLAWIAGGSTITWLRRIAWRTTVHL